MAKADIQLVSKMDVFHLSDIIQNSHTCVWNLQRVGHLVADREPAILFCEWFSSRRREIRYLTKIEGDFTLPPAPFEKTAGISMSAQDREVVRMLLITASRFFIGSTFLRS